MKKYQVDFTDNATGATSPIDVISAPAGYTAKDYINDCREYADDDYYQMIINGKIKLVAIDN